MKIYRSAAERGSAQHGWLKTFHTFSFADYFDPRWMGFHSLRVINEDFIAPQRGFGLHGHRNMEILTYVISGAITHGDTLENKKVIDSALVQYMSAGSGVRHSEMNDHPSKEVHLLQIWIEPSEMDLAPRYQESSLVRDEKLDGFAPIAGPLGSGARLEIRQDAHIFATIIGPHMEREYQVQPSASGMTRAVWIQVVRGQVEVNGAQLFAGDGLGLEQEELVKVRGSEVEAELLLFDLPA